MTSAAPRGGLLASPAGRAVIALVAGLATGIVIMQTGSEGGKKFATLIEPVGTMWVNGIRMTIIPLVTALIITAIASARDLRAVGSMATRAVVVFFALLTGFAIISAFVSPFVFQYLVIDPEAAARLTATVAAAPTGEIPGFTSWLTGIIPSNPLKAAVDGNMLSVIVFALFLGAALARLGPELREPATVFFRAIADAMLVIVKWILLVAPIGVFALAVSLATRLGSESVRAVGFFLVVHVLLICGAAAMIYIVVALSGRVPIATFARAVLPAQVVALSTRSSVAALPAMIEGADRVLKLPDRVAGFVLPFGVSVFRLNSAVSWIVNALFVSKLYGIPLDAVDIATISAASVLFSFSVPGIPSGSMFVITPFMVQIGLPVEGIGILIALDAIPDMFKTLVNVMGHMTATVFVAGRQSDWLRERAMEDERAASIGEPRDEPVLVSAS